MRLALTAVLLAVSTLSFAEPFQLTQRPDGTPELVRPEGWSDGLFKARSDAAHRAFPGFFDAERILVTPRHVDVVPTAKELTRITLADRLDTTQRIQDLYWDFNGNNYFASTAFDRANKVYFAFFNGKAGEEVCEPEGGRLLKSNIPVEFNAQTHYVISLQINIFDPEKSFLLYNHASGFPGKNHKVRADQAMQLVHNAGIPVAFAGGSLTFFYATDVDPSTKKLANTRTLSFVHEDGRDTKYYTIHEEDLPVGQLYSADLGGQPALLMRGTDGVLTVSEPE